jgi:hypothetical protein
MASFLDRLFSSGDYRSQPSPDRMRRRAAYKKAYEESFLARNRDRVPTSVEAMQTAQDFIPGVGDALALAEAYDAATRGELVAAGLLGTGAAIGLVPGAGDVIARPVISAGRNAMDLARRIEVDPSALGSMGGNIRLRPQAAADADEITLFHGSPYDFRSFDEAQIGKGEGAQDLGRGFSLTDEEIVAHSYMNPASRWGDLEAMDRYRQAGPGRTYQVGVKARPDQILDWKKPWKEQVPEGTPLYDKIQESMAKSYADDPEMQKLFQQANLSSAWRDDFGMEDAALNSGFVGNKRQNFSGDTEFTVFDPTRMEIKKVFDNEGRELPFAPPSPAQEVAGLLSSGRADEVTDDILANLTPNDEMELFDLYQSGATGMDLPMDEASRLARAREMGMDTDTPLYHGTDAVFSDFNADMGVSNRYKTGVFSSDNPDVADSYASSRGSIYPIARKTSGQNLNVDVGGGNWNRITKDRPVSGTVSVLDAEFPELSGNATTYDLFNRMYDDKFDPYLDTNALARQRRFEGDGGITFTNVIDRGPHLIDEAAQAGAGKPSTVNVDFYPHNIRSRFARFDPRLAHLRNLSAGVSGLGLLSAGIPQEDQY